jgi:hypothetical protein
MHKADTQIATHTTDAHHTVLLPNSADFLLKFYRFLAEFAEIVSSAREDGSHFIKHTQSHISLSQELSSTSPHLDAVVSPSSSPYESDQLSRDRI